MGTIPKASLSPRPRRWGEMGTKTKPSLSPSEPEGGAMMGTIPNASLSPPDPRGGERLGVYT